MEQEDKAIEIMKAAMEKEKGMKDISKETMEEQIDAATMNKESEEFDACSQMDDAMDESAEFIAENNEAFVGNDEKSAKSSKSLFKNTKSKELAVKDQKIEELTDRLMRTMAEFDNFRKRSEKEKSQMYDIGVKSMIEKLLPIIDNFERGLGAISDKEREGAFAQGIEMIYKQLMAALEEIGVNPIDAVGKEFDPNLHNAVMHGEDENLGSNIVSDEFQKGYLYRDIVVRHSMVKVVN